MGMNKNNAAATQITVMGCIKRHELLFAKALSITKWQVSWLTLPAPSHIQLYKVVYRRKLLSFTVARQPVIFTRFPINSFLN